MRIRKDNVTIKTRGKSEEWGREEEHERGNVLIAAKKRTGKGRNGPLLRKRRRKKRGRRGCIERGERC